MTTRIDQSNDNATGWEKLSNWLKAIDSSLDFDPVQHELNEANRKVDRLELRVRELESGEVRQKGPCC